MADETFSPETHRFAEPRYFDDFRLGERFYIPSRTMTEALFAAFQLASGDNHPIHYDRAYCGAHGHRDLLAHGLLVTAQAAAGAGLFPHVIGDSLYPMPTITELRPGRTTGVVVMRATIHNQASQLVMEGEHRYLLRRRAPPAPPPPP